MVNHVNTSSFKRKGILGEAPRHAAPTVLMSFLNIASLQHSSMQRLKIRKTAMGFFGCKNGGMTA
jgi:hypothetical protein